MLAIGLACVVANRRILLVEALVVNLFEVTPFK